MRKFYLFKIKDDFMLKENNSYHLFKYLEKVYLMKKDSLMIGFKMLEEVRDVFSRKNLNESIFEYYKDEYNYSKFNDIHRIYDYYTNEQTSLEIKNTFLVVKSVKQYPTFFSYLNRIGNIFVCDFKNKDYFWLSKLSNNLVI